jgi:serine/threonine-protein kinase HipA
LASTCGFRHLIHRGLSPPSWCPCRAYKGEARLSELASLAESARKVEEGIPLSLTLDEALLHGSSVGGARPKVLVRDGKRRLIAKFSSTTDTFAVVKDVLLVERFDRPPTGGRRAQVSALTVLGIDEWGARYASYEALADQARARFTEPKATLRELFSRLTFNVLSGNTDDHPRNPAAFWDGTELTPTPAYDICPLPRTGGKASQAMAIGDGHLLSRVAACVARASTYLLAEEEAREIVAHQIETIENEWDEVCELAVSPRSTGGAFGAGPSSIRTQPRATRRQNNPLLRDRPIDR